MATRTRRAGQGQADLTAHPGPTQTSPPPPPPYAYVEDGANAARRWTSVVPTGTTTTTPANHNYHTNMVIAPKALSPPPPPPPPAPPMPAAAQPLRPQFAQTQLPPPPPVQGIDSSSSGSGGAANGPETTLFSGRFTLLDRLGSGGFGDVYRAKERDQELALAVKVEQVTEHNGRPDQSFLFHEAKVLQEIHKSIQGRCAKLKADREAKRQHGGQREEDNDDDEEAALALNPDAVGITKLKYYGQDGMQRVLIMSLHGHSVESVHRRQGRLSLYATVMIADQVLSSLEHVHRAGYVHADLKPDNILFGRKDPEQLYLVDFGLSVRYRDREGRHRQLITNHSFVGTPRYASLRTHMGYTLSRRDDIEQLVYVMIYLFRGRLPWSGLRIDDPDRKEKHIAHMKSNLSLDVICGGCPEAFRDVLNYARCMGFEEEPEYEYLHLLFYSLRERCTGVATGEGTRIPAPPAAPTLVPQQPPQHLNVAADTADKGMATAGMADRAPAYTKDPNIVTGARNDVEEEGNAHPMLPTAEGEAAGLFSDAIGRGILSGNATDAGPLSPRIDCLDGGRSPTCLPLSSPVLNPLP